MSLLSGVSDFFGLDIGTRSIRVVQLSKARQLITYGLEPIDEKVSISDSKVDQQRLAQSIQQAIAKAGINTKNVAAGLPSSKVFTTVVDIDKLPADEMAKTIRYQADSIIPTPVDQSKIDWSVLGPSPVDANKVEVLISSVANAYAESQLDLLESVGLNVIAFESDNLALARALLPVGSKNTQLILDMGNKSTDLVVTIDGVPRLTRSVPTGSQSIVKSAQQNLNVDEKQANEFVFKFGLNQQKLESQVYHAIINTVDLLVADIDKSIKFFETRYPNNKIERIIMTGAASGLPEFPLYVSNKFNLNVEIGNAWANVSFPAERQNDLMSVSNHFAVAAGLAERSE